MSFGLLSLLPPLLAILLALATRNVIPALFCGVWLGATMLKAIFSAWPVKYGQAETLPKES